MLKLKCYIFVAAIHLLLPGIALAIPHGPPAQESVGSAVFLLWGIMLLSMLFAPAAQRRFGVPPIIVPALAGLILGKTGLGRSLPPLHPESEAVISSIANLAPECLMLVIGAHVSLTSLREGGLKAVTLGVGTFLITATIAALCGYGYALCFPEMAPAGAEKFALMVGALSGTGGIVIVTFLFQEHRITAHSWATTATLALAANELVFLVVAGSLVGGESNSLYDLSKHIVIALLFTAGSLIGGVYIIRPSVRAILKLEPHPRAALSLFFAFGCLLGWISHELALTAFLGFFLAGIVLGEVSEIPERSKKAFEEIVIALFIPLYFGWVVARTDYAAQFSLSLIVLTCVASLAMKYLIVERIGMLVGISTPRRKFYALSMLPNGVPHLVIGVAAVSAGIFEPSIVAAIGLSVVLGSVIANKLLVTLLAQRMEPANDRLRLLFLDSAVAKTKANFLRLLRDTAALQLDPNVHNASRFEQLFQDVVNTGHPEIGNGLMLIHVRLPRADDFLIAAPVPTGAQGEFDPYDGKPVQGCLVLVQAEENENCLTLLAHLARAGLNGELTRQFRDGNEKEVITTLQNAL